MTTVVSTTRDAEVAVIAVNNPPVNALSQAVRAGLREAVGQADADASVRAVVILCRGRTFIAGADVTEFDRAPQPPHLPELAQCIEDVRKPVVAALHGTALGGGFEIELDCHYRVAQPHAMVGRHGHYCQWSQWA